MSKFVSIAIDGPAGAGKSTMARACAKALGYLYVDTGAIYRTVGYYMRLMGIGPKDQDGIRLLIDDTEMAARMAAQKEFRPANRNRRVPASLRAYARLVSSADQGAVRIIDEE